MSRRHRLELLAPLLAVAAACGGDSADHGARPSQPAIVATTGIWADVAGNVACGGLAEIRQIVPDGAEPHSFEPSLRDREALEDAELIVANGGGLEASLDDAIEAARSDDTPVFRVADHVGDATDDPHVWFDPTLVVAALPALRDTMVDRAGLDAARVDACVAAYESEIATTDAEIAALVDTIPADRRTLVTNHDSLGHFAERYGLEVLGTVIPSSSTLAEASPADLEALAAAIDEAGVPAIFAEVEGSTADADAVAAAVGVDVVALFTDSLGADGSGAETYLGLLTTDARLIARALTGGAAP